MVSPASEIATQPHEVRDPFEQESPQEVHESQLTEPPSMVVVQPFLEPLSPFPVALLHRWSETSGVVTRQTRARYRLHLSACAIYYRVSYTLEGWCRALVGRGYAAERCRR